MLVKISCSILFGSRTVRLQRIVFLLDCSFQKACFYYPYPFCHFLVQITIQHCLAWECAQPNNLVWQVASHLLYVICILASCFPFSCTFLGKHGISVTHRCLPAFRVDFAQKPGGIRVHTPDSQILRQCQVGVFCM